MKTANEVFSFKNFGKPGKPVNSQSFSSTHSPKNFQVGGNRLTGAWHPQLLVPSNRKQIKTLTARPTQAKAIDAPGQISNRAGQKVPFNNSNSKPLAGSHSAGVSMQAFTGANTLMGQRTSRATARSLTGLNTTTRRGGGSNSHFAKPVAGTSDVFALPGPSGGRNTASFTKVSSVHHIGLTRVVSTKHMPRSVNRPQGATA
jgi:hypothetical protein